jgi:hypothetical protein
MTARKKAEPETEAGITTGPKPSAKSTDDIGLAALQVKADADAARGYIGPEKEN